MRSIPPTFVSGLEIGPPATVFLDGGVDCHRLEFRYPAVHATGSFDRAILSPNGYLAPAAQIDFFAGVAGGALHRLVSWRGIQVSDGNDKPRAKPVAVDILEMPQPSRELMLESRLSGECSESHIARLAVTVYNSATAPAEESMTAGRDLAAVELHVPFISQFAGATKADDSLCCPTSAVMVLRFWGVGVDVGEFSRLSYDHGNRLFGNWSLTAATLSTFGLRAWVQKHTSIMELYDTVASGRPVIVSLSFDAGELPGAPVAQTSGHLLVVRGFTDRGDVMVCDPAGKTSAAGVLVYDRTAFARAWLGHGGIAIHALPEELVE